MRAVSVCWYLCSGLLLRGAARPLESQGRQDVVISAIFDRIQETNRFFVEFGFVSDDPPLIRGTKSDPSRLGCARLNLVSRRMRPLTKVAQVPTPQLSGFADGVGCY